MKKHGDRAHAVNSPSAMSRTQKCPGWVALFEKLKAEGTVVETTSEAAGEGTLAHEIAEYIGYSTFKGTAMLFDNYKYDEEMIHFGTQYAEFLVQLYRKFCGSCITGSVRYKFEQRVRFSNLTWGTVDFIMWGRGNDGRLKCVVIDYKYGKGVEVSAVDNAQMKTYAACFNKAALKNYSKEVEDWFFYIYQPRVGDKPESKWKCSGIKIVHWEHVINEVEAKIKAAFKSGGSLNAEGLDHCRFCPCAPVCPEFRAEMNKGALEVFEEEDAPPAVETLPLETLVKIQEKKKAIEHYLKAVEVHLMSLLERGEKVPGYKLVQGRSVRKWISDEEKAASALHRLGVEEPYRKSLITIGDAEKIVGKGKIPDEVLTKTTPKLQLAAESDKRPAIEPAKEALAVFNEND